MVPEATPPRVFISYSHDSELHRKRVLSLADQLRQHGIEARIDQYEQSPPKGWPAWCEEEIRQACFVVMVCTETYRRRVDSAEEPGVGHGVLWEARLIKQHLYNAGSATAKFVPVLFDDCSIEHVPTEVGGASIHWVDNPEGYEALLRLLTDQPATPPRPIGTRKPLPGKPRPLHGEEPEIQLPVTTYPHPRVEDLFIGRKEERTKLANFLFPMARLRRPVAVCGMAGVGKSYLVDRFYWENTERFPGGYVRLPLDPDNVVALADLLATLRDRLSLPASNHTILAARLVTPLTLIHVENADTSEAGRLAGEFGTILPGCALVISGRYKGLGAAAGWGQVELEPFDETTSLQQMEAELNSPRRESWPHLAAALGYLPLALHLAAGYLRFGQSAEAFLRRLRSKKMALEHIDPADPTFRERSRALLSDTFEQSLRALQRQGRAEGSEVWLTGFSALGHAPAAGFGISFGAAVAGLTPEAFEEMLLAAERLSLIEHTQRSSGTAYRIHPLLAELGRLRTDRDSIIERMTIWFVSRLSENGDERGSRWREVDEEVAALVQWLALVPPSERSWIARASGRYANANGPYHAWVRFCEEVLATETTDDQRSIILWTLANVAHYCGLFDLVISSAQEKCELDRRRGEDREVALASGLIADVRKARGDLDEALRIRSEEELPVYELLGDEHSIAVTQGQIADILEERGDLDEALRIRREEQLPVFERLGDLGAVAVVKSHIADILFMRGDLDEALRIRREEELPVYEHLGEVRSIAITHGQIADVLHVRGDLDEALRIRREEELPVYERLGDVRAAAITKGQIADVLFKRGNLDEALRIRREEQLPILEQLGEIRSVAMTKGQIADILLAREDFDESIRIRREEEIPVFEHLGDPRNLLIARSNLGITYLSRNHKGDRQKAHELLYMALQEARRLRLPEAQEIELFLKKAGLKYT